MTINNIRATKLLTSIKAAHEELARLTPQQRAKLEKAWDVEHAYFSSALEGSKINKEEFDTLAEKVA